MKYSEENVVTIKRDLQSLSEQIVIANDVIDQKRRSLGILDAQVESQRSILARLTNSAATLIRNHNAHTFKIQNDVVFLEEQKRRAEEGIRLAQGALVEEQKRNPLVPNTYIGSVLKLLEREYKEIVSKVDIKRQELDKVKSSLSEIEARTDVLSGAEMSLIARISSLKEEEQQTSTRKSTIETELQSLATELESIRRREHDAKVMEARLSPEYLAVYNSLPRRT